MNNTSFISRLASTHNQLVRRYICPMRLLPYVLFLVFSTHLVAQDGLTAEFANLSAKERTRIAKKEDKEAAQDLVFQDMMQQADVLFKDQQFNEALAVYRQARKRRPYNVHPKVKIQDLQALLKAEEEMNGELANDQQTEEIMPSGLNAPLPDDGQTSSETEHPVNALAKQDGQEVKEQTEGPDPRDKEELKSDSHVVEYEEVVEKVPTSQDVVVDKDIPQIGDQPEERKTAAWEAPPVNTQPRSPSQSTKEDDHQEREQPQDQHTSVLENIPELEDGLSKEVYREANAIITEYTHINNGKTDIYKKVYHQWGYVFYFKNGTAITERMWTAETYSFH